MFTRLLPAMACVALLAACASPGEAPHSAASAKPATMAASMAAVDAAVAAGQADNAMALLKSAAQAYPTDKTPWVRIAQMRFDAKSYGEAIVGALKAIERDPDDTIANSIAAVSGLRVSSQALAELTRKSKLSGNVKSEAEELAKLLRTSLGEDVLVPPARRPPPARSRATTTAASASSSKSGSTSSDPFDALK